MRRSEHCKRLHGHMIVVCLLSVWIFGAAAYGQDEPGKQDAEVKPGFNPLALPYRVTGADVPRYYLVRILFARADSCYEAQDGSYQVLLSNIGLEQGTNAEVAFVRAIERARKLLYGNEGPIVERREDVPMETPRGRVSVTDVFQYGRGNQIPDPKEIGEDEWQKRAEAYNKQQARDFADVYYDLLKELSEQGVSTQGIENYLYNGVAPGASLKSDKPLDKPSRVAQEFESQLKLRRGQSRHSRN